MAKRQKKALHNSVGTGEPLVPEGETVKTLPPALPSPVPPEEPTSEGDRHAVPPLLLSAGGTVKEASRAGLTPRMLLDGLSVEVGLYILIFVVAIVMRFIGLGARPLSQHEAAVAIGAWQFLQGQASGFVGSPFVFSTNLLLFFLGGPNDATVRILPALFGSTLVLLPAFLRRELGRTGSMISSILLLFSSTLVFFSRDSNGVEISVVSGFAAAVMMWRYIRIRRPGYLYFGMAGAAIALTASAAGFSMLIAGVVFALLFRWLTKSEEPKWATASASSNGPVEDPAFVNSIPSQTEWRNAVWLFAIIYVAVATAFSINREGLGAAFNLFGGWLASFQSVGPISSPLNLLPVYEPLSLVFGFAGLLLLASLRGSELRSRGVLIYFAIVLVIGSILYSLSSDKSPENVVVLVVPLAFLAGWLIGNLMERSIQDVANAGGWRALATGELPILTIALVLLALIYVELVEFLEQNRFSANIEPLRQLFSRGQTSGDFVTAIIVLGLLTLAVGVFLTLLAIALVGSTRAANVGSLVVVLLLGLSGMHALSLANFSASVTVDELIAGEQTSLQARDIVHDLEWLSEWREVDPHILPVRADESLGPIVRWYLRGFKNVQWMRLPKAEALGEVLLTTEDYPAPTGSWIDQRYSIQMDWQPEDLTGEALWKWLVFRNGGSENWQYVKLWAPTPN